MRSVALVTSARSDWGAQCAVAKALRARSDVELSIVATGMHLSADFGHTVDQITADGFEVAHRLDTLSPGDTPESIAVSIGQGINAFARLFSQWRPDVITVFGDRFDMLPAAVAATPFLIPIAHIHGGELTLGAFDDALRHAMTKMSHIHLVSTEEHARRVRQMGEQPEHIHVVGAPGLDDVVRLKPLSNEKLAADFGFSKGQTNVLAVYHPETRAYRDVPRDVAELFAALNSVDANIVIVRPNADTGNRTIQAAIDAFCNENPHARAPADLERRTYLSLMRAASVMVGNSSSGLLEAPSFKLPVVNVGHRQTGRIRAANVIDCKPAADAITVAIRRTLSPAFRDTLADLENPYGNGSSAGHIATILATIPLKTNLIRKGFVDACLSG